MDGGVLADRLLERKSLGFSRKRTVMEETSAVYVSRYIAPVAQAVGVVDLVKRVISRDQNLIQLESLILAQSERWRQA